MEGFGAKLARDAAVCVAGAALWRLDRRLRRERSLGAGLVAVATGLTTGAIGFACHEWGHLLGGLATGAEVAPAAKRSPFVFTFDHQRSTRKQYLALSAGGYAATTIATAVIFTATPASTSGRIARVLAVAGVGATVVFELPDTLRELRT